MTKIIVAAMPPAGHTGPLLRIAAHLASLGHEVMFLGGSRYRGQAEAQGLMFTALPAGADYDDRDLAASFPERERTPAGPPRMLWDVMHIFGDPAPVQYRALRDLLADFPAAAVFHDNLFLGGVALALAHPVGSRPAVYAVGVSALTVPSRDTAPPRLGLLPPIDDEQRARYAAIGRELLARLAPAMDYVRARFADAGVQLPPGGTVLGHSPAVDRFLQLTVPGFEFPRSDLPANVTFVGPLRIPADPGRPESHWWPRLQQARDQGRRVVVVTQGTVANDDVTALLAPAVQALADREDLLVMAVTARPDGPELLRAALPELPSNTVAVDFVPFDSLLPHTDLFVTNGGYGGVHAALGHGVPVIVGGDTEDKPEVAARVEWTGTGINLRTGRPTPEALATAAETVLNDPAYRKRAQALAEEFTAYDALTQIATLVADSP